MSSVVQLARVPVRVPRIDLAIAAGLFVWASLEALLVDGPGTPAVRMLIAAGFTLPLAWRRRWPVPVLLLIALVALARGGLEGPAEEGAMPFPALLLGSFSAALYARPRALAYASLPVPALAMPFAGYEEIDYAPVPIITLTGWVAGWLVRRRAEQLAGARARGPELAREAVAAERARMARELHDVVAHTVTLISVQAGAAEAQLGRDAGRVREALEAVRRSAHEALVELRRLVGVLREDEAAYTPQPGLDRLDELIEGIPVELTVEGERAHVPAAVDLAAYRIVQESLTNARRHAAGAPVRVRIVYEPDCLRLEVVSAAGHDTGAGTGHGLAGMRERARLYGGTLEAGQTPGGGFAVRAQLPLESAAAPEAPPSSVVDLASVPSRIPRVDFAIAGGLFAWALLEALFLDRPGPAGVYALLGAAVTLPLVARRRWPLAALAIACVLLPLPGLLYDGTIDGTMPLGVMLLAAFSAGLYAGARRLAAPPLFAASIVVSVLSADVPSPPAVDIAIILGLTTGAWVAGTLIRRRAEQLAGVQARNPELAREAVVAERARLARELHDVVAHSVTLISVQAGAAEQWLERDPERVRAHLEAIRTAAHEALVELRRLVGVLREDDAVYAPQPGLDRLQELITGADVPVELVEEGERGHVPAGVDLAAYRILQESLTNVRRHAGRARTRVKVVYGADSLRLEVANRAGGNGATGPGTGHGLLGMRERARLYGGTLHASPTGDGGFSVRAELPFDA